jgi:hypothetical protein
VTRWNLIITEINEIEIFQKISLNLVKYCLLMLTENMLCWSIIRINEISRSFSVERCFNENKEI